jgi:hypothetical protein
MSRRTAVWIVVFTVIAIIFGGASLIVTNNSGTPTTNAPAGFLH